MKTILLPYLLLIICIPTYPQTKAKPVDKLDELIATVEPEKPWIFLTSSSTQRYYYDPETRISVRPSVIRVWIGTWPTPEGIKNAKWRQEAIDREEEFGFSGEKYKAYTRSTTLTEFDCGNYKFRFIRRVDYDDNGAVIESREMEDVSPTVNVVPGSVSFRMLKNVCNPNYKPPSRAGRAPLPSIQRPMSTPTQPPNNNDPFVARYVGGDGPPKVTVTNSTDRLLTIVIGGTKHQLTASTTKTMTVEPGMYDWNASAPRVNSLEGQKQFERGHIYTWEFYIRATTVTGGRVRIPIPGRRRGRRP